MSRRGINPGKCLLVRTALLLAIAAWSPVVRGADPNPPTVENLHVGFGGLYKVGAWTPVEFTLVGGSQALVGHARLTLIDGDGTPTVITSPRPVQLLPGRRTTVLLYAKFGSMYGDLRIQFQVDDKLVIDRVCDDKPNPDRLLLPTPLPSSERMIVTVGGAVGVDEAVRLHQQATGITITVAALADADRLPTEWYGYDGVDWLVISTSHPDQLKALFDTGARRAALVEWVERGGRLLFTVGAEAPTVLAPDAALTALAPGRAGEIATLRRATDLEGYVGGARKVRGAQGAGLSLSVPRLQDVVGKIEVADGNLPLVVRAPRRFGQVVFVAVDLDQRPFSDWDGRGILVARLLGLSEPGNSGAAGQNNPAGANITYSPHSDLLDSLRRGLGNFTDVTPISFALVAALILGYIVLIGPGDFFLVKHVLKRMELTWVTFPLWVVLVSGSAYALAVYTKGDDLRLNQVDLVDVDMESGWARATSWYNVFSPQSEAFNLTAQPLEPSGKTVSDSKRLLSWLGSGDVQVGSGTMFSGQYEFSPSLDALANVPIQIWSTKSFLSRTAYQCREVPSAKLVLAPDGVPEGTISNDLDLALSECMLLCGNWAYLLGEIKPGATVRLRPGEQRDLKHVLRHPDTGMTATAAQPQYGEAESIERTLEMMLFYKAAGAAEINGTSNVQETLLDFSDLLNLNRAILVGRAAKPATELANAGTSLAGPGDRHWTVYRFVFPISRAKAPEP